MNLRLVPVVNLLICSKFGLYQAYAVELMKCKRYDGSPFGWVATPPNPTASCLKVTCLSILSLTLSLQAYELSNIMDGRMFEKAVQDRNREDQRGD